MLYRFCLAKDILLFDVMFIFFEKKKINAFIRIHAYSLVSIVFSVIMEVNQMYV